MTGERVIRRLAAIVAADVVGYSRLMGRDESGTVARLRRVRAEWLEPVLARRGGRVVKLTGDGALIEFGSAVEALAAAIEFQQSMAEGEATRPEAERLLFRVGLHLGDLIVDSEDLYGDGVNVAARLEAEAPPGGIVVSGDMYNATAGRLAATFDDRGRLALKNIERPVQAYTVSWKASDWSDPTPVTQSSATTSATPDSPPPLPDKPSIAVLPFDNLSGDPEQVYFADGVAEDLITGLSRIPWFFVIARNSSFAFRGEKLDMRTIGERLGVRYLVEGSVRRAGQRVRLTAQLIEATTGNHVWADRYEGSLDDLFDFQDRIASSLIGAIEPKLRAAEIVRVQRKRPESLDAYDLLTQAVPRATAQTAQGFAEAIELLDRAIGLSPGYAGALAFAAACRAWRSMQGYSPDPDNDFREAVELSQRALELDPSDPAVLNLAASVAVQVRRDYQAARDLNDRSLAITPNSATAWSTRGFIDMWAGETEAAITAFKKAMRLSPFDSQFGSDFKVGMAFALFTSGRPEEALPWIRKALEERPNWNAANRALIGALWLSGRRAEAQEAARKYVEMFPGTSLRRIQKMLPFRGTPGQERYLVALREAGLPD